MDFAANSGLIPANPATNVRKAFPTPVTTHMPSIRPEQLPALMQALSVAAIERQTRLLIEWQLLTVTRPAEAAGARWAEIDLMAKTWTIPAGRMKMRRDHVIPLCPQAMAVLEAMQQVSHQREFVFPGLKDPKQPMCSQSANAALKRMGFKGVLVSHGLRAIFSTAANEEGFDADVIEAALAHVDTNSVRRAYNRSNYLEKRVTLMDWWGKFVGASATGTMLAGRHNTASGNMKALDEARGRAQYTDKSLIILPDQPKYTGEGTGIKAITGGDPLEIGGKYEKRYTTVLRTVILATNNEPMIFTERNGGIARRRVIFPFDNPVSEEDKDPALVEKIATELPVIIRRLLSVFCAPDTARQLLCGQRDSAEALTVKRGTDPVIDLCATVSFMSEPKGMMMGGGTWAGQPEPKSYLYHFYLAFLEYHNLGKPLSVEKFARAMKQAAKEYGGRYLTRRIKGRTQTNVTLNDLAGEFLPRAWGCDVPDAPPPA